MLILSRHKDERVVIAGGAIEVIVVEIRGDKVRLGFDAPPEIAIHRSEVLAAIRRSGTHAHLAPAPQPTIVSADSGQLLLRFESDAALQSALAIGHILLPNSHRQVS